LPLLLFVPGPTLPELDGAELPVPAPTMPEVAEPSLDMPVLFFIVPLARPVSLGPVPFVVAELLAGPLSDPPLPWLDCARAGTAANDSMQAAAKIVFFILYLPWVYVQANPPLSEAFLANWIGNRPISACARRC
jgi:hypothetical protein